MSNTLHRLVPELGETTSLIRIPNEVDVPVTARVLEILDTPAMQRLKGITQLGLVAQVYPGARHSRFEHSLGVYALARKVLLRLLATHPELNQELDARIVRVFLLAALVHDVGHWPYCHPIEDMRLTWVPKHESLARKLICSGELARSIESGWEVTPTEVADFLIGELPIESPGAGPVLYHLLNGPVDIDKMDYLQRDSLHAGVPYGRNFDLNRLIGSFCLNQDGRSLAIIDKGKTAAEMMVFARYVMFSEVYWHHAVRSATAMLQRLVFELSDQCNPQDWLEHSDAEFAEALLQAAANDEAMHHLASSLFGSQRKLFKRLGEYSYSNAPDIHTVLARRPYGELVELSRRLTERLNSKLTADCGSAAPLKRLDVLIDAPPEKLEVQFRLPVCVGRRPTARFVQLGDISPVVKSLATEQFDNYVKRARVFVVANRAADIAAAGIDVDDLVLRIAEE